MTAGNPRINCCIEGCARGTTRLRPGWDPDTKGPVEWICGKHWPLVPKAWKRRRRWLWKQMFKLWPDGVAWNDLSSDQRQKLQKVLICLPILWRRMKERATNPLGDLAQDVELEEIERRFGIV